MTHSVYVEDIFVEFYDLCTSSNTILHGQELNTAQSLYYQLINKNQLTQNQGNFILKILARYHVLAKKLGLNYDESITTPVWKNNFRVIDLSRKIHAEKTDSGLDIYMQFPYSLKKEFDSEIENDRGGRFSRWDHEKKLRILNAYNYNLIQLHEFCQKHGFEIDESFSEIVSEVEEIWQHQEKVINHSEIVDGQIVLKNSPFSTEEFWENNRKNSINEDMFLAKSLGYPVIIDRKEKTPLEYICSSKEKFFWLKSLEDFFSVYTKIGGISAVLLDRNTKEIVEWLKGFVEVADQYVPREDIKICFREESEKESVLNNWIKINGLGGKVETGKILIFHHKPPKWLFSKNVDVKIILTNSYTPHAEPIASSWIHSHPCVCYTGTVAPTPPRNIKIAKL